MEAHLARATYLANQYEEDCRKVQAYLETIFANAQDSTADEDDDAVPALVKDVMDKLLLFQGRDAFTGRLEFEKSSSTPELLMEDPAMQQMIDDLQRALPALSADILDSNSTTKMEIEEDEIFQDCLSHKPKDDADLDRTLTSLRQKVGILRETNEKLQQEQNFLQGSKFCADRTVREFERYKQDNLESVGKAIATTVVVTLARTGIHNSPKLLQPTTWKYMADRIMSKLLWWWGQQDPPTMTLETLSLAFSNDINGALNMGLRLRDPARPTTA
mmetsp:Transcript_31667/g.74153  ORF Transcript_31667/g.74153 Transcript_31667/m.74153 type:complete len:274 (-) Transcript_31667:25-846(-)